MKAQIIEILQANRHKYDIQLANDIDKQTSFFVENYNKDYESDFLTHSKSLINNTDGYDRFKLNLDFPIETNTLSDKVFNQLGKIFHSEDRFFEFTPNNKELDFSIKEYKTRIFGIYKRNPNAKIYYAVDDKTKKIDFVEISSSQILEFKLDKEQNFEFVIVKSRNKITYFDKEKILVYSVKNELPNQLIDEAKNKEGFVPLFFVSNQILNSKTDYVRKNPMTPYLAKIEELQRLEIFKKILNPHAFYLFATKYKNNNCNFDDGYEHCESGFMVHNKKKVLLRTSKGTPKKCPECNQDLGIGNVINMGVLMGATDRNLIENPLSFVNPDEKILKYGDEFMNNFRKDVYESILGVEQNLNSNVAHTAESYNYNSSTREQVILTLKTYFENKIEQIENAKIKFLNKKSEFKINLGTKFLISSLESLTTDLENADKNNIAKILNIKTQIIAKKFENDLKGRLRAEILNLYFPNIPEENIKDLDNSNEIKQRQIYFDDYINWFEVNKHSIYDFKDKNKAVKKLTKDFNEYRKLHNLITIKTEL